MDGTFVETNSGLSGWIRGTGTTSNNLDTMIVAYVDGTCYGYLPAWGAANLTTNEVYMELMGGASCLGSFTTSGLFTFAYTGNITVDKLPDLGK